MFRAWNYGAGPSVMPLEVLEEAQREFTDYNDTGISIIEMSHRSADFDAVAKDAEARLRRTMDIPDNYRVLFEQLKLQQMYETALTMLKTTLSSLEHHDIAQAKSVFEIDETLDAINDQAIDVLVAYATEHPDAVRLCIELAGVFRKLERTGDHINNLAEETVFYIDAEVLKHRRTLAKDGDEA